MEESLAQDEQLVELLRVFDDPPSVPAPKRRRFGTGVRIGAPHWPTIVKWTALLLSGTSIGLLIAAILTGAPVVVLVAVAVSVPALLLIGAFAYLKRHADGPARTHAVRRGRRARTHGWLRAHGADRVDGTGGTGGTERRDSDGRRREP
ncbi:hypothetical protein [Embleya sp. MST-111070]|uniref:hypothetical protein n=1 Tax=Embleya sp. MST-111070 TaxID=3398231 RepID=UPI003F731FE9